MQIDFQGKRVVIAGGSKGIGRSIALGFAAAGCVGFDLREGRGVTCQDES